LRKITDEEALISCASGPGVVREEVWEDESGKVARYNLAFINFFLTSTDNGRVLGYDNAHGQHHRHDCGTVKRVSFTSFEETALTFYKEVSVLRKKKR
jgi:hypothetical protein